MSFKSLLSKIWQTPPRILFKKAEDKLIHKYRTKRERDFDEVYGTYLDLKSFDNKDLFSYIKPPSVDFLINYKNTLIEDSKNILDHKFDLLGSGWVELKHGAEVSGFHGKKYSSDENSRDRQAWIDNHISEKNRDKSREIMDMISEDYELIDWQRDFRSGYRWEERTWFRDVRTAGIPGADIKVSWELGRMQHLVILAYCFAYSEEKKKNFEKSDVYANEFINQILDFIAANPPRYGVQWISPMDAAIRAANWLVALDMFKSAGYEFERNFLNIFNLSIYEHGLHILWNLEWASGARGNHYLANIAGLLFISAYLPVYNETANWLAFALQELGNEILHQFNSDGSNFEASTAYHCLSTEMMFYAFSLSQALPPEQIGALQKRTRVQWYYRKKINNKTPNFIINENDIKIEYKSEIIERLHKIEDFSREIIQPGGAIPQIGDNDSGSFFKLSPDQKRELYDKRKLFNIFDILNGKDPENSSADSVIVRNLIPKRVLPKKDRDSQIQLSLIKFSDFGLYIYKFNNYKAFIRCGSVGQRGKGGHAHNDQLSFVLFIDDKEVIADSGTYVYTPFPDLRNKFRSTEMHNTLSIEGMEQCRYYEIEKDDLFWLNDKSTSQKVLKTGDDYFEGKHNGFGKDHIRKMKFAENSIQITDTCKLKREKNIFLHFSPYITEIEKVDDKNVKIDINDNILIINFETEVMNIEDYDFSPAYGELRRAKKLSIRTESNLINWTIEINKRS